MASAFSSLAASLTTARRPSESLGRSLARLLLPCVLAIDNCLSASCIHISASPHCSRLGKHGGIAGRYYNDAWSFCTEELKWTSLEPGHTAPAPRGGCQLALNGDQLFIFGGYSVKKTEEDKGARAAWWAACCVTGMSFGQFVDASRHPMRMLASCQSLPGRCDPG